MKVERYNFARQFDSCMKDVCDTICSILSSGEYILSDEVAHFEELFASYVGAAFCCGVNSGTDALIIALRAFEIGRGHAVITHANTFNATVAAICHTGATPVLVDADQTTFLMDVSQLENAVT